MMTNRTALSRRPWLRRGAIVLLLVLLAAGCGRDDDGGGGDGAEGDGGRERLSRGPGFDGTTIKVGALTPLTGTAAVIGLPLTAGNRVWFDRVNAEGGIAGRYKVELVTEDTLYDAPTTVQKYNKLKGDVALFAQVFGTPPTNAVLPLLNQDDIVASPASLDAEWVAEPNLLPLGGPYQVQFVNAADYLVDQAGFKGRPICLMAVEGPYGDAGLQGLEFAADELGFEVAATARYRQTDTDFTAQVTLLKNADCAAVLLTALPQNTVPIISTGARLGFNPQWVGQSPTWATAMGRSPEVAALLQRSFLLVSEATSWGDESVPGMKEMLADVRRHQPDQQPDIYFIFGYLQGRAVTALLEKAVERGDLSRQGIEEALADLGEVDFEGLSGRYTYGPPEERKPSRTSTIYRVNPGVPGFLEVVARRESAAAKEYRFRAQK